MKYEFETVKYNDKYPAKILLQNKPGRRCITPVHWHSEIEIDYVLSGSLKAKVNGNVSTVSQGDILFCNSEEVHCTYTEAPDENVKYLVILLSNDFLRKFESDIDTYDLFLTPYIEGELKPLLYEISEVFSNKTEYYELRINSLLSKICYLILHNCKNKKSNPTQYSLNENFHTAKKAIEFIGKNYKDDISLNDVSDVVSLSPNYFSKYFKSIMGITYLQYLSGIRLENALRDMLNDKSTVTDAAFDNGFPNTKAFITKCKQVYGCTPSIYKKKNNSK